MGDIAKKRDYLLALASRNVYGLTPDERAALDAQYEAASKAFLDACASSLLES